jgi:hypothetical protein
VHFRHAEAHGAAATDDDDVGGAGRGYLELVSAGSRDASGGKEPRVHEE